MYVTTSTPAWPASFDLAGGDGGASSESFLAYIFDDYSASFCSITMKLAHTIKLDKARRCADARAHRHDDDALDPGVRPGGVAKVDRDGAADRREQQPRGFWRATRCTGPGTTCTGGVLPRLGRVGQELRVGEAPGRQNKALAE